MPRVASTLETAFRTALKTFAQTNALAVDWGDEQDYRPGRERWLRPRINPAPTKPGPSNAGPLRGELRGLYSIEVFTPIALGQNAAFVLADDIGDHFLPNWQEPGYVTDPSGTLKIRISAPSVDRIPADDQFNRAAAHIPYLTYVIA